MKIETKNSKTHTQETITLTLQKPSCMILSSQLSQTRCHLMTLDLMQMTHSGAGGNKKLKDTHKQTTSLNNPAKVVLCDIELMIATNLLQIYNVESLHFKAK